MNTDIVYFYDKESEFVKKEHVCLNNFEPSPFTDEKGQKFISVEHYYQCHKFDNIADGEEFKKAFEEVLNAKDADTCKKASRRLTKEDLKDKWQQAKWENGYKDFIMKKGLTFKFSQNLDMLKVLMETGDKKLVERSEKDPYWGGFLEGSKNMLGNMLMEIRENYLKTKTVFIKGSEIEPIKVELQ